MNFIFLFSYLYYLREKNILRDKKSISLHLVEKETSFSGKCIFPFVHMMDFTTQSNSLITLINLSYLN